jgi:hypothetical protein
MLSSYSQHTIQRRLLMQDVTASTVDHPSDMKPTMLRALQEEGVKAGNGEVSYVSTAKDLLDALNAKAQHIEITEHLDLTVLEKDLLNNNSLDGYLTIMNSSKHTWSIRVRPNYL